MQIKRITIIGLGLIGGSFGLALNKKNNKKHSFEIVGYDLNIVSMRQAVSKGAVHWGTTGLKLAVEGSDLIILAVPVGQMEETVKNILPYLKKGCIIFDTGSTKEKPVQEISRLLPADIYFVGGHPMAGSERSGISGAHPYLFENAIFVITPGDNALPEILDPVVGLIELTGAKPKIMSPRIHDQAVAGVSHLPYIIAVLPPAWPPYFCRHRPVRQWQSLSWAWLPPSIFVPTLNLDDIFIRSKVIPIVQRSSGKKY
jgi:prephenate dehydrogenase